MAKRRKYDEAIKAVGPLAHIIAPIVAGQIRSFLNDHPEALGKMRRRSFHVSLAKRIVNDLLCRTTVQRMRSALGLDGAAAGSASLPAYHSGPATDGSAAQVEPSVESDREAA